MVVGVSPIKLRRTTKISSTIWWSDTNGCKKNLVSFQMLLGTCAHQAIHPLILVYFHNLAIMHSFSHRSTIVSKQTWRTQEFWAWTSSGSHPQQILETSIRFSQVLFKVMDATQAINSSILMVRVCLVRLLTRSSPTQGWEILMQKSVPPLSLTWQSICQITLERTTSSYLGAAITRGWMHTRTTKRLKH